MSIKFTVREIATNFITVDYEDGSWAQVPIRSDFTREQIETIIADFNHSQTTFTSVEDVPFTVGETITAKNTFQKAEERRKEQENSYKNQVLDYKQIRAQSYPPIGDQLDALYWARNGDTSQLEVIDAKINEVKETYPKDMSSMTRTEFDTMLEEITNNVLG